MRSRRVLGAIALIAIVVAAISFAVVDVSTSAASGCLERAGSAAGCGERAVPGLAVTFAVIGAVALVAGIVPAVTWIVHTVSSHHVARHTDVDYSRRPSALVRDDELEEEEQDPTAG